MAGFFGIGDFTKEGKGVDKDAPKKRGPFAFLELFFRKFWKLSRLNMLYAFTALPTFIITFVLCGFVTQNIIGMNIQTNPDVAQNAELLDLILRFFVSLVFMVLWGMGPVTAGFTYVLRNYSREEHAWLWSDFWQHTKANFKQALVVWLIDLVMLLLLYTAHTFYSSQKTAVFYIRYVILWIGVFYTMMHFYIYPIMVTFKMPLRQIYKNALLFSMAKLPLNIVVLVLLLLINVGVPYFGIMGFSGGTPPLYWFVYFVLEFFIFISLSGFIVNFSAYQGIKKYMLPPEEAENEEETEEAVYTTDAEVE